jgi:hypothetical protein
MARRSVIESNLNVFAHFLQLASMCVLATSVRNIQPPNYCRSMFIFPSEDSPAPNALHSFKAHVANGKIHVTANPAHTLKDNKSRPARLLSNGSDVIGKDLVIVGGGSGAFNAVESLREVGYSVITQLNLIELSFLEAWL